jgi:peptide/nickel transport system permease protein
MEPNATAFFGTDIFGQSVSQKVIKATETAVAIGIVVSMISIFIGTTLGMIAGYFGGVVDEIIVWFYTTLSSIPSIMLLVAIAFILGKGTTTVFLALGLTSWVGLCRIVRAEVMKHKEREYIQAANAIGATHSRKMFRHILPNISHLLIINFTQTFDSAVKSEVVLSFLGLGVVGRPSWGTMIDDSKLELARGVWWQLAAATLAMFLIVLAFNILGDALRDALDPKLKGK